jgi:predicted O-methyltransferase YrrM
MRTRKVARIKRMHWLANLINQEKFKVGVEVGAATGHTTEWLLEACPSLRRLFIADDWRPVGTAGLEWDQPNMEQIFRKKFEKDERIHILKGLSWDVASAVTDHSLDFAFIDASHDYESVKKDLTAWYPKIKFGGIICGHDIHSEGVVQAVTEKFGNYSDTKIDHVWWVQL